MAAASRLLMPPLPAGPLAWPFVPENRILEWTGGTPDRRSRGSGDIALERNSTGAHGTACNPAPTRSIPPCGSRFWGTVLDHGRCGRTEYTRYCQDVKALIP